MEPPAAAAYAVLPVGVDIIRPGNENGFDKSMNNSHSRGVTTMGTGRVFWTLQVSIIRSIIQNKKCRVFAGIFFIKRHFSDFFRMRLNMRKSESEHSGYLYVHPHSIYKDLKVCF